MVRLLLRRSSVIMYLWMKFCIHQSTNQLFPSFSASLHSSVSASINASIFDKHLDLFAVVEPCHASFELPSIIAATPPKYRVIELARPRSYEAENSIKNNYGGIYAFFYRNLKVRLADFSLYKSFEQLPFFLSTRFQAANGWLHQWIWWSSWAQFIVQPVHHHWWRQPATCISMIRKLHWLVPSFSGLTTST